MLEPLPAASWPPLALLTALVLLAVVWLAGVGLITVSCVLCAARGVQEILRFAGNCGGEDGLRL